MVIIIFILVIMPIIVVKSHELFYIAQSNQTHQCTICKINDPITAVTFIFREHDYIIIYSHLSLLEIAVADSQRLLPSAYLPWI